MYGKGEQAMKFSIRPLLFGGVAILAALGGFLLLHGNRDLRSVDTVGHRDAFPVRDASGSVQPSSGGSAGRDETQSPVGSGGLVSRSGRAETAALMIRGENWSLYPGTLADQVSNALESGNPAMAHYLGNRLADCVVFVEVPEALGRHNLSGGLGVSTEDQLMKSLCQSVPMNWQETSWKLLELAVNASHFGAAADMFRTSGKMSDAGGKQIVLDAAAGHLWSTLILASVPASAIHVAVDDQLVAKYALLIASRLVDPETGRKWAAAVQQIAGRWGTDVVVVAEQLTSSQRASGEAMARKIVDGL